MHIFINDISKTALGDFHTLLWSTNPASFMRFRNTRCKRGRAPMEIPNINRTFLLQVTFPNEIIEEYGGSKTVWVNYTCPSDSSSTIYIELQWFNKTEICLPESFWIELNPILPVTSTTCNQWKIDVLGYDIDPSKIVDYGARRMHVVGQNGIRLYDQITERSIFSLQSYDAIVLSIGSPD